MKFAFGVLHWTPDAFWQSTLPEVIAAIDGHNEANGVTEDEPMTHEEANDLLEEVRRKRRKARLDGDRR